MDIFLPLLFIGILLIAAGIWHVYARHGKHHHITGPSLIFLGLILTLPFSFPAGLVAAGTIRCGHMPVVAASLSATQVFSSTGQRRYFADASQFATNYFCTPSQAIAQGYTNDPLN